MLPRSPKSLRRQLKPFSNDKAEEKEGSTRASPFIFSGEECPMTDYRNIYYQLLLHLTTVARSVQAKIKENQEREQASFESLERLYYLKGQIDLLDDIEQTVKKLKSQD